MKEIYHFDLPVSLETPSCRVLDMPKLWRKSSKSSGSASSSLMVNETAQALSERKYSCRKVNLVASEEHSLLPPPCLSSPLQYVHPASLCTIDGSSSVIVRVADCRERREATAHDIDITLRPSRSRFTCPTGHLHPHLSTHWVGSATSALSRRAKSTLAIAGKRRFIDKALTAHANELSNTQPHTHIVTS